MNQDLALLLRVVRDAKAYAADPDGEALATETDWAAANEPGGAWARVAAALEADTLAEEDYPAVREVAAAVLMGLQRHCDRGASLADLLAGKVPACCRKGGCTCGA